MPENRSGAWPSKPLRELAQVVSGGTPSRYVGEFWEDGTIPWVTPTDLTNTPGRFLSDTREKITHRGLASCSATLLPAGTLLMTSRATLGEIRVAEREVCTNQGFKSLVPFPDTHGLFLYYQMLQNKERYRALGIGSTFLEVNKRDTERFEVLVPPDYNNQQRIAEILSTVDEAIEQTEALIAKTQQIKAGLMHDLFTRGVTADGQLRPPREEAPRLYKESPLGWIPKEWEPTSLKEEVGISHGFAFSGDGFFDAPPGAVLLTPGNFYRDGGLYFTPNNTKYFRGDIPEATVLSPGEMVTVMTDLSPQTLILGRFAVIDTGHPVLHNQRIGLVRIKEPKRWEKQFLATALNQDRIRREIIVGATGTTVRHTSPDRILSVHFARPPMDEQRKCAEIVASVDARLAAEDSTREKLERTKRGLMSDLLTGRVRVSTQDPSEPKEVAANV